MLYAVAFFCLKIGMKSPEAGKDGHINKKSYFCALNGKKGD